MSPSRTCKLLAAQTCTAEVPISKGPWQKHVTECNTPDAQIDGTLIGCLMSLMALALDDAAWETAWERERERDLMALRHRGSH